MPRDVEGLLVPVAASTTHLAFSSIRLEPTWMAIGHAAGIAAHLAIRAGVPLSKIDIAALQRELLKQGQVLTYFKDLTPADPSFQAMQFFGTKGFFEDYYARPKDPLHYEQAVDWLKRARPDLELPRQSGAVLTRGVLPDLFPGNPSAPVSRGEFCQALYR